MWGSRSHMVLPADFKVQFASHSVLLLQAIGLSQYAAVFAKVCIPFLACIHELPVLGIQSRHACK